jgi:hypothetical protein
MAPLAPSTSSASTIGWMRKPDVPPLEVLRDSKASPHHELSQLRRRGFHFLLRAACGANLSESAWDFRRTRYPGGRHRSGVAATRRTDGAGGRPVPAERRRMNPTLVLGKTSDLGEPSQNAVSAASSVVKVLAGLESGATQAWFRAGPSRCRRWNSSFGWGWGWSNETSKSRRRRSGLSMGWAARSWLLKGRTSRRPRWRPELTPIRATRSARKPGVSAGPARPEFGSSRMWSQQLCCSSCCCAT